MRDIAELTIQIQNKVSNRMDLTRDITDEEVRQLIDTVVQEEAREHYLSIAEKTELKNSIFNSMRGLNTLQPLENDPSITEIMINGSDDIFVEQNGRVFRKNVSFWPKEKLENVIQAIVSKVNRTVNESNITT